MVLAIFGIDIRLKCSSLSTLYHHDDDDDNDG